MRRLPGVGEIVLCGYSLGTAFATQLAARGLGDRLLLVAPFTSIAEVAASELGGLPPWLVLGAERLDSLALAPSVTVPTVCVSGGRDASFPPSIGRRLADAFPYAEWVMVLKADHAALQHEIVPMLVAMTGSTT